MKKYSIEWKEANRGGWVQYHKAEKLWKRHWVEYGTEYSSGEFFTKAEAESELQMYVAASMLGRKGGRSKSPAKQVAS